MTAVRRSHLEALLAMALCHSILSILFHQAAHINTSLNSRVSQQRIMSKYYSVMYTDRRNETLR